MTMWPVVREIVNREGFLLLNANAYVKKLFAAVCSANCFRIRHSSLGPFIVRVMYYTYFSTATAKKSTETYASEDVVRNELLSDFVKYFFLHIPVLWFRRL